MSNELQFCYINKNGHIHPVKKGETIFLYPKYGIEFFVDERCVGRDHKNKKSVVQNAKWAFIYNTLFEDIQTKEDQPNNLWGNFSGGTDVITKYGIGKNYSIGSRITFAPNGETYYYGFKQRVELFSEIPGDGFYFYVVPVSKSNIQYAYFNKSETVRRYGESIKLEVVFHGYNLDKQHKYKAKIYLLEEGEAKGLSKTEDLEEKNLWKDPLDVAISREPAKNNNYNSYFVHNFNIDIEWKKDSKEKKNFTLAVEIYQAYQKSHWIGKDTEEWKWIECRNFADKPTTDLVLYDSKILGLKDLDNKNSISSRFMVSEELMDHYITRVEQEKTNMIQYIGDIRYTKKEYDPCGYSKIIIKDEDDKEREALVVFDEERDPKVMDLTSQIFGIIAGDERKNISITVDKLTTKGVLCRGLLLEAGKKHSEQKNVFQLDRVMPALRTKNGLYLVEQDPEDKNDSDVIPDKQKGLSKDVSDVQQWQFGTDYKFDGENKMLIMPRYVFNKTFLEKTFNNNAIINELWLFNYFILTEKMVQTYFVPISTCRYPNQIAKINVYPNVEWTINLKLGSTLPNVYSYTNMPTGPSQNIHQQRAVDAGQNRRWLNKEVSFELTLKASTGSIERSLGVSYEEKIEKLLKVLVKIKEILDNVCGVTSARQGMARQIASSLPGTLARSPITFQLDYPVIAIEGGWKFDYNKINKKIETQGKLAVGLTPLIKGTGKIDLIACAEFIPPAKPIIVAIRTAISTVGADIWFNLYAFGQIDISYTFLFGVTSGVEPLNIATTVGFGAELGVKASAEVPKINFSSNTTEDMNIGFEASAKGETSIIVSGKQGMTTDGIYIEPSLGFGGMVVSVTAKASIWKMGVGFEDKLYELLKPEPDLVKGRFYILEANKK